jgi:hypothetical protein
MARPITCESLDGNPAAYMITDLSDGTTFAVCVEHWVDLCTNVANSQQGAQDEQATPGNPVPDASDHADFLTGAEIESARSQGIEVEGDGDPGPVAITPADLDEPVQRARTRRKLAERPDSTATSEANVPWPRVGEDPHP